MTVEQADFVGDLFPTTPDGLDQQIEGDNQFRLIKKVLQNTWPGLNSRYSFVLELTGSYNISFLDIYAVLYLCGDAIILGALLTPNALGDSFRLTVIVCAEGEDVVFNPGNGAYVNSIGNTSVTIPKGTAVILMITGGMWKVLSGLSPALPPNVEEAEPAAGWMFYTTKVGAGADSVYLYEIGTASPTTVGIGSNASNVESIRGSTGRYLFYSDSSLGGRVVNSSGALDDITAASNPTLDLAEGDVGLAGYIAAVYNTSTPVSARISDGLTDKTYTHEDSTDFGLWASSVDAFLAQQYFSGGGSSQRITRFSTGATIYSRVDELAVASFQKAAVTGAAVNYTDFAHKELFSGTLSYEFYINGVSQHSEALPEYVSVQILATKSDFYLITGTYTNPSGDYVDLTIKIVCFVWNGVSYTKTIRTFSYTKIYDDGATVPDWLPVITGSKCYVRLRLIDCVGTPGVNDNFYKILILDSDGGTLTYYSTNLGINGIVPPSAAYSKGAAGASFREGLIGAAYWAHYRQDLTGIQFLSSSGVGTDFLSSPGSLVGNLAASKTVAYGIFQTGSTFRLLGSDGTNVNLNTSIGLTPIGINLFATETNVYALIKTTSGGNRTWSVDKSGTVFEYTMPDTSASQPQAPVPSSILRMKQRELWG